MVRCPEIAVRQCSGPSGVGIGELLNCGCDPAASLGAAVIAIGRQLVDAVAALLERFVAVTFGTRKPSSALTVHGYPLRDL